MATVSVDLNQVGSYWAPACRKAMGDLNHLFSAASIGVVLSPGGSTGPSISVVTDPSILGTAVHGHTTAESVDGRLTRALVRLPVKVVINTPSGVRGAGLGILEVIAAHEFVHALGQELHNSHLMAQTLFKQMGDSPDGDRLKAGGITLPPLLLAPETVDLLKSIWG